MKTKELDRLVSRTQLTPINKIALREVRKAMMTGRAGSPEAGEADWSIGIITRGGTDIRFHFEMKKVS